MLKHEAASRIGFLFRHTKNVKRSWERKKIRQMAIDMLNEYKLTMVETETINIPQKMMSFRVPMMAFVPIWAEELAVYVAKIYDVTTFNETVASIPHVRFVGQDVDAVEALELYSAVFTYISKKRFDVSYNVTERTLYRRGIAFGVMIGYLSATANKRTEWMTPPVQSHSFSQGVADGYEFRNFPKRRKRR